MSQAHVNWSFNGHKTLFSRDDVLAAVLIDENSDSEDSDDKDEEGIGAYIGPELPDSELVDDYDDVETVLGGTKDVVNSPQDPQDVVNSPQDVVNSHEGPQDVVNSPQDVVNSPQAVVNSLQGPQDVVNSHNDAITEESKMEVEVITGDLSNASKPLSTSTCKSPLPFYIDVNIAIIYVSHFRNYA